ncbi:MAG: ATP-binding protein [Mariprofundales bacterium]|nr:ATP-binding protein [Mariprofundales bacterium]
MSPEFPLSTIAIPLPLFCLSFQGTILDANLLAQEDMGRSLRRLQQKDIYALFGPRDSISALLTRVEQGEQISDSGIFRCDDHAPYTIHAGPNAEGCVLVLVPETRRSEAQQLEQRYAMAEAVARIALELAHEVKNPLAALRGATQWMAERVDHPVVAETSERMLHEVDRIRSRIDDFLQLAPRADISMGAVSVHRLVMDVCRPVPESVKLSLVLDLSLPEIPAHESRLRQAMENLWQNALESGATWIEVQTRLAVATALPHYHGPILQISFQSNGEPIPVHLRQRLFEPFVTSKASGSGLGLAIVQRVALEHGGRVRLQADDAGARFVMHLPMRAPTHIS